MSLCLLGISGHEMDKSVVSVQTECRLSVLHVVNAVLASEKECAGHEGLCLSVPMKICKR